ncbi:F/Y-rich N-terminus-domain-containing protein [Blakeslea trispora]|nr:F/Y-rich N-terminus-domain-containing protein [Blakeslea trispora]
MTNTLSVHPEEQQHMPASSPQHEVRETAENDMLLASSESADMEESYKQLKRKIKEITELNVAMNRDYFHAKKKIRNLTFERNLLLDSISKLESANKLTDDDSDSDIYSDLTDSDEDMEVSLSSSSLGAKSKILKKLAFRSSSTQHRSQPVPSNTNTNNTISTSSPAIQEHVPAPHKRSRSAKIPVKTRRVQPIERDADGKPKLPQQIGVLTVHNLGTIVTDRPNFHNERYIFPVGYTVSRTYPSMVDPNSNTIITSTIVDDGSDCPRFHVTAADMPDEPIIANSATGAWTVVVRRSNEIRNRDHSNSASGPDYYGFKHPTIANLIQDLPGAKELKQYVWQNFEEMEPRAAKGVMAAAEKKRGNLEQMGNANRKIMPAKGEVVFVDENGEPEIPEEDEIVHSDRDE